MDGLRPKQKRFCEEYVNNGFNGTQAYKKVYPNSSDDTARINACRLLTKANIKAYISEYQEELRNQNIMTATERMEWLSNVIKNKEKISYFDSNGVEHESNPYMSDKMKAMEILNKMTGEYTTKIEADVDVAIRVDLDD